MYLRKVERTEIDIPGRIYSFSVNVPVDQVEALSNYVRALGELPTKNKVKTIKMVRTILDLGLKEAKWFVDHLWDQEL